VVLAAGLIGVGLGAWDLDTAHYGVNSDESSYHQSSRLMTEFVRGVWQHGPGFATPENVDQYFRWNTATVIHPTFSRALSALSRAVLVGVLGVRDEVFALRFHNALCLGLTSALIVFWLARRCGWAGALAGVLLHWGTVRYLGHVHVAQTDIVLSTLWLVCACIYGASEKPGWTLLTGLLLGAAIATKYTAVLLFPVLYALDLLRYGRRAAPRIAVTLIVAIAVFVALNPIFWRHPLLEARRGAAELLARREGVPIPSLVLGRHFEYDVPWFTAPLNLLATTPLPLLLLGGGGSVLAAASLVPGRKRRRDAGSGPGWEVQAAAAGFAPLAAMMLPGAMAHDLERLFLPLFPLLALLGGAAAGRAWKRLVAVPGPRALLGLAGGGALLMVSGSEVVRSHPNESVYFNQVVGGVAGARRLGFDVFYLKNEFTDDVVADLNRLLPSGARLGADYLIKELRQQQEAGKLRSDVKLLWGATGDYFLVYWRMGWITPWEQELGQSRSALYEKTVSGVPCISLYALGPEEQAPVDDAVLAPPR
jgi:hypothetical protein